MRSAAVVVVASLNIDLTVSAPRIPAVGETIIGTGFATARGGKGGNQTVGLARLGIGTTVIGCLGDDDGGRAYGQALIDEGVAAEHVRFVPGIPTGTALITVSESGENSIVVVPGANALLSEGDIAAASRQLERATVVLAQLEVPASATARAFELARAAGAITVLNPAPASEDLGVLLTRTDVLVPNEVEFAQLTGVDRTDDTSLVDGSAAFFAAGVRWVVVTLGENGVALIGPDSIVRLPAASVVAVDTTAAGDSFLAGLVSVLAANGEHDSETMLAACRRGTAVAAWAVQRAGAHPSLPLLADLG